MSRFRAAAILALVCTLIPVAVQAAGDQSSDLSGCAAPYIAQCGCGLVMNPQTKQCVKGNNSYKCTCQQTDSGVVTSGMCIAQDKCLATKTNGQTPEQPTEQQTQQANNGQTAGGAGTGSPGASAQVTPASGVTLQPTQPSATPSAEPPTTVQTQNSIVPGTSVLENAFQWITGEGSVAPTSAGNIAPGDFGNDDIIFNPQPIVPTGEAQSFTSEPPTTDTNPAPANPDYQPAASTFSQTVPQPMGSLQTLTQEQVQSGNSYTQSTLTDQSNGQATPQNINTNDVTGTIYYPGCVNGPAGCSLSQEGGLYGSRGNLLDPNVPTVAAGYSSGYQYGQVLSINNPTTGLSVNAVVGDVCPGCGSGIDLTPAAANAIGFTQEQGVASLQVGVVANTSNYSDGSQMTVALNTNPNALNPWSAPPLVSSVSYSQPDFASLSTPTAWSQTSADLDTGANLQQIQNQLAQQRIDQAPEPPSQPTLGEQISKWWGGLVSPAPVQEPNAEPVPTVAVETGANLPEPSVPVEPNLEPSPSAVITQGPSLVQPYPVASVQTGASLEQPYPTTQVETGQPLVEPIQPSPTVAVETGPSLEQPYPTVQVEQGPALEQPQPTAQVTSEPLPLSDQQVASLVPTPESVQTNPQADVQAANQAEQTTQNEGLAFSPPAYGYNWANSSENEALAYQGENIASAPIVPAEANYFTYPDNGENPLALAEQNVPPTNSEVASAPIVPAEANDFTYPPTTETQPAQTSELNNANPYDSGNQYAVTATCQGGGGICGGNSASAAPGGTPLNGDTNAVAVPKDNPYGLKIGDTVSVQIGGNVAQNVPVTDYTGSGSTNYVVSGALEQQLGGTGKDAALITPSQGSIPLPGSTPPGQGGIGSDYVSGQQQTQGTVTEPQPQITPQTTIPSSTSITGNEGLAFDPPGYEYSNWAQPSENEALAYAAATTNSEDEALAYGGTTPTTESVQQTQESATPPTAEQEAENSGNPYDCSGTCAELQAAQEQANKQAAASGLVNNSAVAKSGLNALASAGAGGADMASINAGMTAVKRMSSEASTLGDTQLVSQINSFLGVQNKMVNAYSQYNNGNWGAVGTLLTLQGQAVSLGGQILSTINSKYGR